MSKSDWSRYAPAVAIALGGALYWAMFYSMGFSHGAHEARAQKNTTAYAANAAEDVEKRCVELTGAALAKCATEIVEATHESQRSESDLSAQWYAADWVAWATILAGIQLIATALGLVYVKRTLEATLEAVNDTSRATAAMLLQNELAEEAQRPWIIARCRLTRFTRLDHRLQVRFVAEFENVGKTVARDFIYGAHFDAPDPKRENLVQRVDGRFAAARAKGRGDGVSLIPGEIADSTSAVTFAFKNTPELPEPVMAVVTATAYYRIKIDGPWHETEVSFIISGPDEFDMCVHPTIAPGDDAAGEVHVRRYITGRVN